MDVDSKGKHSLAGVVSFGPGQCGTVSFNHSQTMLSSSSTILKTFVLYWQWMWKGVNNHFNIVFHKNVVLIVLAVVAEGRANQPNHLQKK